MHNKELKPFPFKDEKNVFQCKVFSVHEKIAVANDPAHELKVYTLSCSNWVNVVPITPEGHVVLVEQHRFGSDTFTIEVPGGAVDRTEKDTTLSAVRELEEETGLTSKRILSLPSFYPNPAIQSNRICYFIAFDVQPLEKPVAHFDPFEEIKLHVVPFQEALGWVQTGQISHALSALALLMAEPYLKIRNKT